MHFIKKMVIAGLLIMSTVVWAHTGIKWTYPANEQVLKAAPEHLVFNFGVPVRLMKVILAGADQKSVDISFKPSAKAGAEYKIEVPEVAMGEYNVSWVSMGKDGHKMTGDFSFMVQAK